jgi:hypothetical protein
LGEIWCPHERDEANSPFNKKRETAFFKNRFPLNINLNRENKMKLKQPSYLDVQFKNIPSKLKSWNQWLVWCAELDEDGKTWKKVPYRSDGNRADYTDASDYMSYDEAKKQLRSGDYNGLMFAVTENDQFTAVDIDHCIMKNGNYTKLATDIIGQFDNTYWEISPSGKGLRGFVIGEMPDFDEYYRHKKILGKKREQNLEMAGENKPFTITGHRLDDKPKSIKKNQDAIDAVCEKYMKRPESNVNVADTESQVVLTDDEVLDLCRKAKNASKYESLWSGNHKEYGSRSEADLALCSILAFYTQDLKQVERLFRQSVLGNRDKWTDRSDYRISTLTKAINGQKETYKPKTKSPDPVEGAAKKPKKNLFLEWDEKKQAFKLDEMRFLKWLEMRGFGLMLFNGQRLLFRSQKNVVELITEEDVKFHVMQYLRKKKLKNEIEVIHRGSSRIFGKWFINSLPPKKLKFLSDTKKRAFIYFKNVFVEVKPKSTNIHGYDELVKRNRYVWKKQKLNREYHETEGQSIFEVFVRNTASYRGADPKVKGKQKKNQYGYFFHKEYYNVIRSFLGEKLHSYKDQSQAVASVIIDARISEAAVDGGTGKSLLASSLKYLKKSVQLDGRKAKIDSRFAFQNVDLETQLVVYDDAAKRFPFELLFQNITGDFSYEYKGIPSVLVPFKKAPKFIITTNHPMVGYGHSFDRRQHIVEVSDFYRRNHPKKVHGEKLLFDDWDSDEWNSFFGFMTECLQFYLKNGLKHKYSESYEEAKLRDACSPSFVAWAKGFFKIGKTYKKETCYQDWLKYSGLESKVYTQHKFSGVLKKYATGKKHAINPNSPGGRDRRNSVDYITLVKKSKKTKKAKK